MKFHVTILAVCIVQTFVKRNSHTITIQNKQIVMVTLIDRSFNYKIKTNYFCVSHFSYKKTTILKLGINKYIKLKCKNPIEGTFYWKNNE